LVQLCITIAANSIRQRNTDDESETNVDNQNIDYVCPQALAIFRIV
jgi:hypothetical protein